MFLWSNVSLAVALLLSFYLTFADPAKWWPAGFAGLPFFYLWLACLLFLPLWVFNHRRYWLISLIALLLTVPGLIRSWGFHLLGGTKTASEKSFTIMSFNSSRMGLSNHKADTLRTPHIYEELAKARPDILCIQEFFSNSEPTPRNHLDSIRIKLRYDYYYTAYFSTQWDHFHFGTAIFSRFPIVDTAAIELYGRHSEDMISARLLVHGDTIRILSAHLASYRLQQEDYGVVTSPKGRIRGVAGKMRRSFALRSKQANIMKQEIEATKEPLVVVGDFNDVPASYTYNQIRGNLQDAFLAQGSGLGRTFSAISPHLRIDYILPDNHFKVEDFAIFRRKSFEHYPIMTRLSMRK